MYCGSEICIVAPKYIFSLRNMLSRRHAHVRKPSLYSMASHRPHILSILIPGSHSVPPLVSTRRKVLSLWRCHIAPAKPNGPIPFDLNDKYEISPAILFFSFVTGPIPIYTGSIPGPARPGTELSVLMQFKLVVLAVFSPCPNHVRTASSEICNAALKYVMVL